MGINDRRVNCVADGIEQDLADQIAVMSAAISRCPNQALYGPSKFWDELSQKHMGLIRNHGFGCFKRTVNFEYNQWGVTHLWSVLPKHVLKGLIARFQIPYVAILAKSTGLSDVKWKSPAKYAAFAYRVFVALLWQYASLEDRLGVLDLCLEPSVGKPLEIFYRGRLISQDLAQSSLELNRIVRIIGDMSQVRTVAEIGAGYGRLGYVFAKRFPEIEYSIFDIPPALAISQNYLACTLGHQTVSFFQDRDLPQQALPQQKPGIRAFLPHQIESFTDGYWDLMINISSFDEMTLEQIEKYLDYIDRKCKGWLYLKGYAVRDGSDRSRPLGIGDFPFRQTWEKVYQGIDPVHPEFIEVIYDLRDQKVLTES